MIEARPSVYSDAEAVALDIRPEDAEEIDAASGRTPQEVLLEGFRSSTECFTVYREDADKTPLAMFGYFITEPGVCGVIWLLGANGLMKHRYEFLRKSGYWVNYIQDQVPLVYNLVYEKNVVHIKWLEWLGFKLVHRHEQFGYRQVPFIEFVRLRHV